MTARTLGQLLNEVPLFLVEHWQYSPKGHGPCAAVKGAYWDYNGRGDEDGAKDIAVAFTTVDGKYAYESEDAE